MDRNAVAALLVAGVFVATGLFYAYDRGSFREVDRPDNGHKDAVWLAGAAILFCLFAIPFAILQGMSSLSFRREVQRVRGADPEAVQADYAGSEGEGVLFEGPHGRTLLLRPPGGIGAVRTVSLPPRVPSNEPASPEASDPFAASNA